MEHAVPPNLLISLVSYLSSVICPFPESRSAIQVAVGSGWGLVFARWTAWLIFRMKRS